MAKNCAVHGSLLGLLCIFDLCWWSEAVCKVGLIYSHTLTVASYSIRWPGHEARTGLDQCALICHHDQLCNFDHHKHTLYCYH